MLEGRRTSLDAIVHPRCPIFVLVERYRCGLAAEYGHTLDDGDFVLVRVLCKGSSTGLEAMSVQSMRDGH